MIVTRVRLPHRAVRVQCAPNKDKTPAADEGAEAARRRLDRKQKNIG
jgi:hypothetical protein